MKRKSEQHEEESAPKQARVVGTVSFSLTKVEGKEDVAFAHGKWSRFNPQHLGPVSMLLSDKKTSVTFKDLSTLWTACYPATTFVASEGTSLTPDYDKYVVNLAKSNKSKESCCHGAWAKYIVVDGEVFPASEANKRLYIGLYRKHVATLAEFKQLKQMVTEGKDISLRLLKSSSKLADQASHKSLDEWEKDGVNVVPWEVVLLNMLRDS